MQTSPGSDCQFCINKPITSKPCSLSSKAEEVVSQAKTLTDRLIKFDKLYHDLGSSINKVGDKYDKTVSSYNSRLKPALRNIQKLQGIEEHVDKEMEQLTVKVKPVLERSDDDGEDWPKNNRC